MLKQQKGITLLTLVFVIIAMLALAAVAIAMILDELSYDPDPVQIDTGTQVVTTDNVNEQAPTTETPETSETSEVPEVPEVETTVEPENVQ